MGCFTVANYSGYVEQCEREGLTPLSEGGYRIATRGIWVEDVINAFRWARAIVDGRWIRGDESDFE